MSDNLPPIMPRGLIPEDPAVLEAVPIYIHDAETSPVPASFLIWPSEISYWGNDKYGDCVSAEEAFAKAAATLCLSMEC